MTIFPNNTMAEYVTKLLNRVELEGDWEVGLSEILFSKTWYNVRNDEFLIIDFPESTYTASTYPEFVHNQVQVSVSEGFYTSPAEIVNELNAQLEHIMQLSRAPVSHYEYSKLRIIEKTKDRKYWPKIEYNSKKNKVEIALRPFQWITFTDGLRRAFGFKKASKTIKSINDLPLTLFESERAIDLNANLQAFYVYCDIVEGVRLGDTESPLLRIVDTGSESAGHLARRHYQQPLYVPVRKKNFEQIEIKLLTDRGRPVPFESGRVIVTLHFRKSERNYFI